jgi:hypothetical protein
MSSKSSFQKSFDAGFRRSSEPSDVTSDALTFEPSNALRDETSFEMSFQMSFQTSS